MAPSAAKSGKQAVQNETAEPKTRKPLEPIAEGWYSAVINSAAGTFFKTGSFGIKFNYMIIDDEKFNKRHMYENIILRTAQGKKNEAAHSIFLKRLDAAGLTSEEVENFNVPADATTDGDLGKLKGAPVRIKVAQDKKSPTYRNVDGQEVPNMRVLYVALGGDEGGPEAA